MGIINMKMIGLPLKSNIGDSIIAYPPIEWLAERIFGSLNQDIKS
jgi:hypothetical protein